MRLFRLHLHPKQIAFKVRFTKWLFQFVGRVGAYPSARLAHASARRMGTDRSGAWGVGRGFWGRLQRERRVCWSVAVFKFLFEVCQRAKFRDVGRGRRLDVPRIHTKSAFHTGERLTKSEFSVRKQTAKFLSISLPREGDLSTKLRGGRSPACIKEFV